jgi:hypothetical protein
MTDPIDHPEHCFRVELDGGTSVYAENEQLLTAGDPIPIVTIRLPASRAHALAHLMHDWVSVFRVTPDRGDRPSTALLGRSIEDAAQALGETSAMACASRSAGGVPSRQRLAAVGILRVADPSMSPVERIAVVDAAARWLGEESGGELAFALLRAACSSEVVATQAYVELLAPAHPIREEP